MSFQTGRALSRTLTLLGAVLALGFTAAQAQATDLRVKCEKRSNRSKASIDAHYLPGGCYYCGTPGQWYSAVLTSGVNTAKSDAKQEVGDEVGFDFDSNARDIKKGATPISKDFIVNGTVTGTLLDANGDVVATSTVACRVR